MANYGGKGFILTTKFYNNTKNDDILGPNKKSLEGKESLDPEEKVANKKEQKTQTTSNAENSRQQALHEDIPSRRRQDTRNIRATTLYC